MSRTNGIVYCNCCGGEICTEVLKDKTSFLTIQKEWGYFSEKKDGKMHSMDICESCYEKLIKSFAIPPDEKQITEYV